MFGFSIQKLIFTVAIVLIVWYGFKVIGRLDKKRKAQIKVGRRRKKPPSPAEDPETENMVACAVCGTFVSSRGTKSCGREGCPYPG